MIIIRDGKNWGAFLPISKQSISRSQSETMLVANKSKMDETCVKAAKIEIMNGWRA